VYTGVRFPLPGLTARVDGCQKMHPSSRTVNSVRELGPWTRVVETDLNCVCGVKPGFYPNEIACVGKQPIMVATASTEHSYWLVHCTAQTNSLFLFFCLSFSIIIFVYACVGLNRVFVRFWSHVNKNHFDLILFDLIWFDQSACCKDNSTEIALSYIHDLLDGHRSTI